MEKVHSGGGPRDESHLSSLQPAFLPRGGAITGAPVGPLPPAHPRQASPLQPPMPIRQAPPGIWATTRLQPYPSTADSHNSHPHSHSPRPSRVSTSLSAAPWALCPACPLPRAFILSRYHHQRQNTWACPDSSLCSNLLTSNTPLALDLSPAPGPFPPLRLPSVSSQDHTAAWGSFSPLGSPHRKPQNNPSKTAPFAQ